jgi:hypothetical protein
MPQGFAHIRPRDLREGDVDRWCPGRPLVMWLTKIEEARMPTNITLSRDGELFKTEMRSRACIIRQPDGPLYFVQSFAPGVVPHEEHTKRLELPDGVEPLWAEKRTRARVVFWRRTQALKTYMFPSYQLITSQMQKDVKDVCGFVLREMSLPTVIRYCADDNFQWWSLLPE